MIERKKVYSGIDVGKLIASILVVVLHAVETSAWIPCEVKFVFTRFAVPFFFIASGFFFYIGLSSAKSPKDYVKKYEKNVIKIIVIWELIIYLPFTLKSYMTKYAGVGAVKLSLYLFRRIFIIGSGPYWYLVALFWATLFIYLCYTLKKGELLLKITILLGFVIQICYSSFQTVLSNIMIFRYMFKLIYWVWSWEFNFLLYGIPFMGLGYLISKYNISWRKNISIIAFVETTFLRILEYNIPLIAKNDFWNQNNISLGFILQAVSFFMIFKDMQINISKKWSLYIRQLSSTIYFTHAIVLYEFLNPILCTYTQLDVYSGFMIFPKVVITLCLCVIFFTVVKKIDNKYLNILING